MQRHLQGKPLAGSQEFDTTRPAHGVSVIIPTHNRTSWLRRALESVVRQTYPHLEIMVVDDGSVEDISSVVNSFVDPRIRLFVNASRLGGSAARNVGIRAARCSLVAFLDSDDVWFPKKVEKQYSLFAEADDSLGLVYSGARVSTMRGDYVLPLSRARGAIYEAELYEDLIPPTSTVMVRKECFDSVGGFDESLRSRQDYDMWIRITRRYTVDYVEEPLACIHWDHQNRIGCDIEAKSQGMECLIRKIESDIRHYPRRSRNRILASHAYHYGRLMLSLGNPSKGRKELKKAVMLRPAHIKYWLFFCLSCLGTKVNSMKRVVPEKWRASF